VVLLVGGTDPSGGAGLAADLKSAAALGTHGCIAVTAITVQNSGGVTGWTPVDPAEIAAQMMATCDDGLPSAVKTGMLGSRDAVQAVARVLEDRLSGIPVVVDPVMVAGSGDGLAEESLEDSIRELLIPSAKLVTPNLDEAEALTGMEVRDRKQMEKAATAILDLGAQGVLLKGGHLHGRPWDILVTEGGRRWFPGERIIPGKVHGTGCTLASSCASLLAWGYSIEDSVVLALQYLRGAIASSFSRKLGILPGHFPFRGPEPPAKNGTSFYRTPRFCPSCGGTLAASIPHPSCSRCGLVFYRNPLPAVILVLRKGKNLLVARRALPPAVGEHCLPGGFIDLGESPEEAAARELLEETGLKAESIRLLGAERDATDYGSVVLYIYEVESWEGEPHPSDDVSELEWMNVQDIPPLAFRAHDRVVAQIRKGVM